MRKQFSEFFRPTEGETVALWADAVFIFDTNVLLNLYRLSRETSNKIKDVLVKLKGRLFLPHQVGTEFFKHREGVIAEQVNGFERVRQSLKKIPESFGQEFTRHPCIPIAEITDALAKCVDEQVALVAKSQEENQLNFLAHEDPVLQDLDALFADCTEEAYTAADDAALDAMVDARVASNSPPCFTPTGGKSLPPPANNPNRGDGRVWFQIVRYLEQHAEKPIIFVTDDQKPNWWRMAKIGSNERAVGPHFQLIRDIKAASGKGFLMYTQEEFLAKASKYLDVPDQAQAIQEVKQIRQHRARHRRRRRRIQGTKQIRGRSAEEKDASSPDEPKASHPDEEGDEPKQESRSVEKDADLPEEASKRPPEQDKDTRATNEGEVS